MQFSQLRIRPNVFSIVALASLAVGSFIPAFYDWTGSDQSRSPPIVGLTAVGLLAVALAICLALPWLPFAGDPPACDNRGKFRFKIRTIFIVTAAVAALAALSRSSALPLLTVVLCLIALGFAIHFWMAFPRFRGRLLSLLACMYLPFVWVIRSEIFSQSFAIVWFACGFPAFLPAVFVSSLVRQHPDQMIWLSSGLTSLELICGLWLIRRGPRLAIAFHLFALLLSAFGSFGLNALMRM